MLQVLGDDWRVYARGTDNVFRWWSGTARPVNATVLSFQVLNWDGSYAVLASNNHRYDWSGTQHRWTDDGVPVKLAPGRTLVDMAIEWGEDDDSWVSYLDSTGLMQTFFVDGEVPEDPPLLTGQLQAPPGQLSSFKLTYTDWSGWVLQAYDGANGYDQTFEDVGGAWNLAHQANALYTGTLKSSAVPLGDIWQAPGAPSQYMPAPIVGMVGRSFFFYNPYDGYGAAVGGWDVIAGVPAVELPCNNE
ncbi:MAG TPA: hypothetical protein VMJ10_09365 [Kofleriaceae bacterium]|nr:hypothetical protein [Kofleriaceae bacterium]